MSNVDGKMITQCFQLLSRFCLELEVFDRELRHQVTNKFSPKNQEIEKFSPKNYVLAPGKTPCISRLDESQWIYQDYALSFPIKARGKGNRNHNYLGFQISISGNSVAIPDCQYKEPLLHEPLLHVCFWQDPITFNTGNFIAFPFSDDPEETDKLQVVHNRLLKWTSQYWTFSLKLFYLKKPKDLSEHVIQPVVDLLNQRDPREALPDIWFNDVLVKYPSNEKLLSR